MSKKNQLIAPIESAGEPPASPPIMVFVPVRFSRPQLVPPLLCSRRLYVHLALLMVIICMLALIRLMSQVKVNFVHYHLESDPDAELVTLPSVYANSRGAFCLDGSPPAYYFRPSPSLSVKFWIIYLPGGGWCSSTYDCFQRSLTDLGSSHIAKTSIPLDGILSNSCVTNPDFCYWNVIVLHYCDGSSFLGNESRVRDYESQPLYLRGAVIFETLIEYLKEATELGDAEQIVLAGTSAGGIGALIHADRLRTKLPQSVRTLHVLVDAAMFVNTPDVYGQLSLAQLFKSVYQFHSIKASASIQECTHTQNQTDEWRCLLPEVYNKFVFTPAFFMNSIYDSWQRTHIFKITCSATDCPHQNLNTVYAARDRIRELARNITASKKNGVFLTWCPLHTILIRPWFLASELGNPSVLSSLISWLQHDLSDSAGYRDVIDLRSAVEECKSIYLSQTIIQ